MNPSEQPNDAKFFWLVTGGAVVLAALPYVVGVLLTPSGYFFQGNTVLAPGDPNVYYSYIEQARQGAWLMRDVFTTEAHQATLWQPVWLILGWLANLLHLSTPGVYALGRLLSMMVFSMTAWWAIRWLWSDQLTRRFALLSVLGASGLGGVVAMLGQMNLGNVLTLPPDLWVSEMVPLLSSWTTPHFLLVTSGILFVLVSVEKQFAARSWRRWWVAGFVGLLTLSIHPFHLLTWITLWICLTIWRWARQKKFPLSYVCQWGSVLLISTPAVIYYLAGLVADPIVIGRASQNINLTPNVWMLLAGLGVVLVLASGGLFLERKTKNTPTLWLGAWAIIHLAIIYFPFMSQRRLMHGLVVPLALLAALALVAIWRRWGTTMTRQIFIGLLSVAALGGSNLVTGNHIIHDYQLERQGRNNWEYFLNPEYQALFTYLKTSVPTDRPILASLWDSNLIAGFTARTVFVGHPVETIDYAKKFTASQRFFQTMSIDQQMAFIQRERICYILFGNRERAYGKAFQPTTWPTLTRVWAGPTMIVYQATDCDPGK